MVHASGRMATSQYIKLIQSQLFRMIQVYTRGPVEHFKSRTEHMECCTIGALTGLKSGYDKEMYHQHGVISDIVGPISKSWSQVAVCINRKLK